MKESSGANRHIHYLTDSVKKLNIPGRQFIYYNCLFCHAQKMSSFGHDPLFFIICLNNTKFFLESIMFLIIIRNLSLSKGYSRVPYLNDIAPRPLSFLNCKYKKTCPGTDKVFFSFILRFHGCITNIFILKRFFYQ